MCSACLWLQRTRFLESLGVLSSDIMPPKKGASSKAGKSEPMVDEQPEIRQKPEKLADVFKRGNALRKLRSAAKGFEDFSEDTLLLEDGSCDITLGALMASEGLDKKQAVKVMLQFREESEGSKPVKTPSNKGWTLPPSSKKSKAPVDAYEAKP